MNHKAKVRVLSAFVLCMMAASFLVLPSVKPVHASGGIVQVVGCATTSTVDACAFQNAVVAGDALVVMVAGLNQPNLATPSISSVVDTLGTSLISQVSASHAQGSATNGCAQNAIYACVVAIYSASLQLNGADTVTVTLSSSATVYNQVIIYEINGVSGTPTGCKVATSLANPAVTASQTIANSGDFEVAMSIPWIGSPNSGAGAGYTLANQQTFLYSEYATGLSGSTTFPFVNSSGSTASVLGCSFPNNFTTATLTTTTTSVVSTTTVSFGGGASTGGYWIPSNPSNGYEVMTYSQNNVPSQGTITNASIKIEKVDITAAFTTVLLVVYATYKPNQVPSPTNPMVELGTIPFTLTNNTGSQYLHVSLSNLIVNYNACGTSVFNCETPGASMTVCGLCYYGIGLVVLATGSNSAGPHGTSGIEVWQISGSVPQWYGTPANSGQEAIYWYVASTIATPLWGYVGVTIAGAVTTMSGTSTITTITNPITTTSMTSTVTITSTVGLGGPAGPNFAAVLVNAIVGFGIDPVDAGLILDFLSILGVVVATLLLGYPNPFILLVLSFIALAIDFGFGWLPLPYFIVVVVMAIGTGALKMGKLL